MSDLIGISKELEEMHKSLDKFNKLLSEINIILSGQIPNNKEESTDEHETSPGIGA